MGKFFPRKKIKSGSSISQGARAPLKKKRIYSLGKDDKVLSPIRESKNQKEFKKEKNTKRREKRGKERKQRGEIKKETKSLEKKG